MSLAYKIFLHEAALPLDRPHDGVDMLLGQDNVTLLLHGREVPNLVGNLRVINTIFGWEIRTRIYQRPGSATLKRLCASVPPKSP